jgi:hypothetical protein
MLSDLREDVGLAEWLPGASLHKVAQRILEQRRETL